MPVPPGAATGRGPDEGASEVVGSILMVAITVAVAAGFVTVLYGAIPAQETTVRATLSGDISEGANGWGTGDETVSVAHKGGNPIESSSLAIVVEIAGIETRFTESGANPLDHAGEDAFNATDDTLSIGDTWTSTDLTIDTDTRVSVTVVDTTRGKTLWTGSFRSDEAACDDDTEPPTVSSWTQDPSDVTVDTTGDVNVSATVLDNCGVDTTQDPHLHYRVNAGSDPAFNDTGAMTLESGTTWNGTIPDPTWADHGGKTLEYKLVDMTDENGNTGESGVQQDVIEDTGGSTTTPVTTFTVIEGTASSNPESAASSDDGSEATFTEEGTTTSTSFTMDANGFEDPQNTWSDETNAFTSDDTYATTTSTSPVSYLQSSPSTITNVSSVILHAEVSINPDGGQSNDAFQLAACFPSGACGDLSAEQGSSTSDVNITYDVTDSNTHPLGNASWTESDLEALQLEITPAVQGQTDGTWRVDRAWTTVSGNVTRYSLEVQGDFSNVSSGTHTLEQEYRVDGDTYDVQVYDWTTDTWNTRGPTLDQGSATTWSYQLTSDEYDGANDRVRMRYLDRTDGTTQGQLFVDYLQVVTS